MLPPKEFKDSIEVLLKAEEQEPVLEENTQGEFDDGPHLRASGETVSASKTKSYTIGNIKVKIKCNVTVFTRYNSTSKRRFIMQIKKYSSQVSGSGYHWKANPTATKGIYFIPVFLLI